MYNARELRCYLRARKFWKHALIHVSPVCGVLGEGEGSKIVKIFVWWKILWLSLQFIWGGGSKDFKTFFDEKHVGYLYLPNVLGGGGGLRTHFQIVLILSQIPW